MKLNLPQSLAWKQALASASLCSLGLVPAAIAQTQSQPDEIAQSTQSSEENAKPATKTLGEVQVSTTRLDVSVEQSITPVEILDQDALNLRSASSLGATLDGLNGVRNNHFGAGAGRPIIRGADGPRVRILSDGTEVQDASTSSPDHAVAIEPQLATQIEVLRGPSTLLYGGGITGGVVNVLDGKIPTEKPAKGYTGTVGLRKDSAAREGTGLFSLTGGSGPIVLHAEALKRSAQDYRVGSGWSEGSTVVGSDNKTWYGSLGASWVHERGYLGLAYSNLRSRYGLPGHSHEYESCHLHGNSLHCGEHDHDHGDGHDHDHDHSSSAEVPLVDMQSKRWDLRGEWRDPLPGFARVKLRAGFTDYQHDEIEDGAIGTTFTNKAHDARLEFEHLPIGALRGVLGTQFTKRKFAAIGSEAYVEPSKTNNAAIFALEEYQVSPDLRLELGLRYEWQRAKLQGAERKVNTSHDMGSISGGASWNLVADHVLAVSLSASERAPTAEELFSNGVHLASNTYERGNSHLKAERSHNLDVSLRKTAGSTRYQLTAFHNRISNYIYAATSDQYENFRLIDYRQRDATFNGLEARISQQLSSQWRVGAFGDLVHAKFEGGDYVPRVPSHRLGLDAGWNWQSWSANAEVYRNFEQNRLASYETRTPAYTMLNFQLAYQDHFGSSHDQSWEVFARLDNALNKLAYNHSSFVKTQSPLRGRNLRVGLNVNF